MTTIKLRTGAWQFDETQWLGGGGFGAVFLGTGADGQTVAIKRLRLGAQVNREIRISDHLLGHNFPHVIPILDVGLDPDLDEYFIVMAQADQSLQDLISKAGQLDEHDAVEILEAITAGLDEISALVHRDLKPGNVLSHHGVWKLADLGLARFVEAATGSMTMRDFLSPQYAAPEQWKNERATKATDIYALGCIAYALLTGAPPFTGSGMEDFAHHHILSSPPSLQASSRLRQIVAACLSKQPLLRPEIKSLRVQLQRTRVALALSVPANLLADAAAKLEEERIRTEAEAALRNKIISDRKAAAAEAVGRLQQILEGLVEQVLADAPNAERKKYDHDVYVGGGSLTFSVEIPYRDAKPFGPTRWDVLAVAMIEASIGLMGTGGPYGRSANLFFGKLSKQEGYRWYEVAFDYTPTEYAKHLTQDRRISQNRPFGLYASHSWNKEGIEGFERSYGGYEIVTNPRPIDGEHLDEFYSR
jgi:serine/threonine-protein kinase